MVGVTSIPPDRAHSVEMASDLKHLTFVIRTKDKVSSLLISGKVRERTSVAKGKCGWICVY